ncbi:MAG: DUF362 domain-containing protein, partial [Dehalococcoidia bacterium]
QEYETGLKGELMTADTRAWRTRIDSPEASSNFRNMLDIDASYEEAQIQPFGPRRLLVEGKSLVTLARANSREEAIAIAVELAGGWGRAFDRIQGANVLLKVNLNSADAFPASTHPEAVRYVIKQLKKGGVGRVVIGDCSGPYGHPTRETMRALGLLDIAEEEGAEVLCFEDEEWVRARPSQETSWTDGIICPKAIFQTEYIVSLPAMKTHRTAVFTLSLKNVVGLLHPKSRWFMHSQEDVLQKMVAEANLIYSPNLIILDGMKCFVSGGPIVGEEAEPRCVIVGDDRIAVDAVGVAVLKAVGSERAMEKPTWEYEQIKRAGELQLGSTSPNGVLLKTADQTGRTDAAEFEHAVREHLGASSTDR